MVQAAGILASVDAQGATGAGSWQPAGQAQLTTVYVTISNTATVAIQGSPDDGTTATNILTGITASGIYTVTGPQNLLRGNVTAWTNGTVDVDILPGN
jgi:hypothetical protein